MALYPSNSLSNIIIGGPNNNRVAIAVKAKYSSPLAAIRFYTINQNPAGKSGYAGGTGGRYTYELCYDDAGKPGDVKAGGVPIVDPEYPMYVNLGGFPLVAFPTFPILSKGKWYHFLLTNIDATPVMNYISADFLQSKTLINPDPDSFVEFQPSGLAWINYKKLIASPVGWFYADGNQQGNQGYQVAANGSTMGGEAYGFIGL